MPRLRKERKRELDLVGYRFCWLSCFYQIFIAYLHNLSFFVLLVPHCCLSRRHHLRSRRFQSCLGCSCLPRSVGRCLSAGLCLSLIRRDLSPVFHSCRNCLLFSECCFCRSCRTHHSFQKFHLELLSLIFLIILHSVLQPQSHLPHTHHAFDLVISPACQQLSRCCFSA